MYNFAYVAVIVIEGDVKNDTFDDTFESLDEYALVSDDAGRVEIVRYEELSNI